MSAQTPACQLLERQDSDFRDWLWVAAPRDDWWLSSDRQRRVWGHDIGIVNAAREAGHRVSHAVSFADARADDTIAQAAGAIVFWPKAHALGEWWLVALCQVLPAGTPIKVVGEVNGGIKRAERILKALGMTARKDDTARRCQLWSSATRELTAEQAASSESPLAVAGQWTEGWGEFEALEMRLTSHPGLYGNAKLDPGTALLLENLPTRGYKRALDIGAGDGIISCWLARHGARVMAGDVSAFAVEATRRSLALNGLEADVRLSDVFAAFEGERFEAIVANPPFHHERDIDYGPAARLISQAPDHLMPGGTLTLVANAFLPYPDLLQAAFGEFEVLAETRQFKVYRARKAR
ncbi:methyltransferase [Cobetia amphilecti]|uniref:methyltransferase n=1 Tax=Cobetia amphilecti TaxID=1055104 RepID=UPI002549D5F5|nr:methyltransferase [Cobetia amphilecti]